MSGPTTPNAEDAYEGFVGPERRRMPTDRESVTHRFQVGTFDGYVTAGVYEDGSLGEVFLKGFGKEGSTLQAMLDAFATMLSIAMQYGAPLDMLARKFSHMRFEPHGETDNPEIPRVNSIVDYVFRWLALRFGDEALFASLAEVEVER